MISSYAEVIASVSSFPQKVTPRRPGFVQGGVRTILRLEGFTVLAVSVVAFAGLHASWWLFAALFLAPDVSFVAYLMNPRLGAIAYNALHSYIAPLLLGLIAHFGQASVLLPIALIWVAHIGFDRAVGYGLKYGSAFGDTHLGHKGPQRIHANATKDVAN
jgi:hypothetical protein